LHFINRNNNSDRAAFIAALLSAFILIHYLVCRIAL
jgi:hypothetical protein